MFVVYERLRTAQVSLSILSAADASTSAEGGDDDEDEVEDEVEHEDEEGSECAGHPTCVPWCWAASGWAGRGLGRPSRALVTICYSMLKLNANVSPELSDESTCDRCSVTLVCL